MFMFLIGKEGSFSIPNWKCNVHLFYNMVWSNMHILHIYGVMLFIWLKKALRFHLPFAVSHGNACSKCIGMLIQYIWKRYFLRFLLQMSNFVIYEEYTGREICCTELGWGKPHGEKLLGTKLNILCATTMKYKQNRFFEITLNDLSTMYITESLKKSIESHNRPGATWI